MDSVFYTRLLKCRQCGTILCTSDIEGVLENWNHGLQMLLCSCLYDIGNVHIKFYGTAATLCRGHDHQTLPPVGQNEGDRVLLRWSQCGVPCALRWNWWRYITSNAQWVGEAEGWNENLLLCRWGILCSGSLCLCARTCFWPQRSTNIYGEERHPERLGPHGISHVQLHYPAQELQLREALHQGRCFCLTWY